MEQGRGGAGRRRGGIGELAVNDQGGLGEPGLLAVQAATGAGAGLVERRQGQGGQPSRPGGVGQLSPPQRPSAGVMERPPSKRDGQLSLLTAVLLVLKGALFNAASIGCARSTPTGSRPASVQAGSRFPENGRGTWAAAKSGFGPLPLFSMRPKIRPGKCPAAGGSA